MWGSTVVVYRDNNGYVSTAAIAVTGDVLATSTNGTSYANLTTKGKSGYIGYAEDDSVAYYSNSVAKTETPTLLQPGPGRQGRRNC